MIYILSLCPRFYTILYKIPYQSAPSVVYSSSASIKRFITHEFRMYVEETIE